MRFVLLFACATFGYWSVASGSTKCSEDEFSCDEGNQCILKGYWCNRRIDCHDRSDESYCGSTSNCRSIHFKCNDGRCIPSKGRCDGYKSCADGSDEENCAQKESLEKARQWILSEMDEEYGWGENTQRAIISLHFADPTFFSNKTNKTSEEISKRLNLQLALEYGRGKESEPMSAFTLSLYINALLATCHDPSNFHGINLVEELREEVNQRHELLQRHMPFVYLTLCLNKASTDADVSELLKHKWTSDEMFNRTDLQATAFLALSCLGNYHYPRASDQIKKILVARANRNKFGDTYSAGLLFQAMSIINQTGYNWNDENAWNFTMKSQRESGSFGDILSTYYFMPFLSGRPFESLGEGCNITTNTGLTPLEVLQKSRQPKISVRYSLMIGLDMSKVHTIQFEVPENISFFDMMRLAEAENPVFKFEYETISHGYPVVYSINRIPNDAESGVYWHLATTDDKNECHNFLDMDWKEYTNDIRDVKLKDGDQFVYLYE